MDMSKFIESLSGAERLELQQALNRFVAGGRFSPTAEELKLWSCRETKIEAIKAFRNRTGLGLKDSKDVLDKLAFKEPEILPCPEFESPPKTMYFGGKA